MQARIAKFAKAALKRNTSTCAAIREVATKFADQPRALVTEVLVGLKLNPATVRTQVQLGRAQA